MPLKAYRATGGGITFNRSDGYVDRPLTLPCGQCIGCRLEHSRQWAIRCVHEAQMHQDNCFITLTYNDAHLPILANGGPTLVKRDFQLFMKRLRKKYGHKIRYYQCGEYGEKTQRPHYHACLFGHDFKDKVLWKREKGVPLYVSAELVELWSSQGISIGFSTIGSVTFQSAAYVARYIMKKITGNSAVDHYRGRQPEYTTMSRRPGIAKAWFEKYHHTDVAHDDTIILNGKAMRPPKYYDRQYEILEPNAAVDQKYARIRQAKKKPDEQSPLRLKTKRRIKEAQLKRLKRELD